MRSVPRAVATGSPSDDALTRSLTLPVLTLPVRTIHEFTRTNTNSVLVREVSCDFVDRPARQKSRSRSILTRLFNHTQEARHDEDIYGCDRWFARIFASLSLSSGPGQSGDRQIHR